VFFPYCLAKHADTTAPNAQIVIGHLAYDKTLFVMVLGVMGYLALVVFVSIFYAWKRN